MRCVQKASEAITDRQRMWQLLLLRQERPLFVPVSLPGDEQEGGATGKTLPRAVLPRNDRRHETKRTRMTTMASTTATTIACPSQAQAMMTW